MSCSNCRTWKQCPGMFEWFAPGDIRFCRKQMYWLLENLTLLESGQWPVEPHPAGIIANSNKPSHAYYENPVLCAAEVTRRLVVCGRDGELTRKVLADGWDYQSLAEMIDKFGGHTTIENLERKVRRCVAYIGCFQWPRKLSYKEFVNRGYTKSQPVTLTITDNIGGFMDWATTAILAGLRNGQSITVEHRFKTIVT